MKVVSRVENENPSVEREFVALLALEVRVDARERSESSSDADAAVRVCSTCVAIAIAKGHVDCIQALLSQALLYIHRRVADITNSWAHTVPTHRVPLRNLARPHLHKPYLRPLTRRGTKSRPTRAQTSAYCACTH